MIKGDSRDQRMPEIYLTFKNKIVGTYNSFCVLMEPLALPQ